MVYALLRWIRNFHVPLFRALPSCIFLFSGSLNVLLTTPLWVANTRLKLQGTRPKSQYKKTDDVAVTKRYSGLVDCIAQIYKDEGISSLWNGTLASLVLVSAPAIHFVVYELLKRWCLRLYGTDVSSMDTNHE